MNHLDEKAATFIAKRYQKRHRNDPSPVYFAFWVQVFACFIGFGIFIPLLEWALDQPLAYYKQGIILGMLAAFMAYRLEQPTWWKAIHLLFAPLLSISLMATDAFSIEPLWFLGIFCLLFLVYWSTFKSRVPLYLTSSLAKEALGEYLMTYSIQKSAENISLRFLDVGAGTGTVIRALGKQFARIEMTGIEHAPIPFLIAKLNTLLIKNVRILWGDFWKQDLTQYDIVYAYLSPAPMQALWEKVNREMRPGTILISNSFIIPDIEPDEIILVEDFHHSKLYIWHIKKSEIL